MDQSGGQRARLRELDALRGLGALAVVLFHYTTRFPDMFPDASHVGVRLDGGHYGVLLFFALSGFSIFFSLAHVRAAGDFAAARFARLFPAYWAAMAVTLTVQAVADVPQFRVSVMDALVNITMLQSYAKVANVDGAYWTLAVELAFYTCMAVVWRLGLLDRIERVLVGWLAVKWLLYFWPGMPEPIVALLVLRYVHFFAIGLVSYRVYCGSRSWRQQAGPIAAILATIVLTETWDVLVVALMMLGAFHLALSGRLRWLCVRPMLWLGAMSYPLYLVHQQVGMTIMLKAGAAGIGPWGCFMLALATALALGWGIHRLIERPVGDRILARWRAARAEEHMPEAALGVPGGGKGARRRLTELDALRGLGALLVVNFHYATRFHEMFPKAEAVPFHVFGGDYRVLLFFTISGFAIYFTMNGIRSVPDFMVNRFARLFPAYWAAITVTLTAEYLGQIPALGVPPWAALVNFTMLQGFFFVPPVDGAYWTLAVELGFYASMLALWKLRVLRGIEPVLMGWLLLKWLMHYWPDMPERVVMLLVLRFIPFFTIGILSYRVWSGARTWTAQIPYYLAALITVAVTNEPDFLVAAVALVAIFATMVEGGLRWLCVRPLTWVGGISYSLYLVHQNVGFVILLTGDRYGISPWVSYGAALTTAFALGTAINRFIERPAANWILRWWTERRTPRSVLGAT